MCFFISLQVFLFFIRGCLNFVFDAEKARFFVQIDAFLSAIVELRLEKRENLGWKDAFFKPKDKI